MSIFVSLFAGLGLFFIGVRLISANLRQVIGRRLRQLIAAWEGDGADASVELNEDGAEAPDSPDAAATRPVQSHCMHFIQIGHGAVALGQFHDLTHGRNITRHGIDGFKRNQLRAVSWRIRQQLR